MSRSSTELTIDYGENVRAANELQAQFEGSNLQLRKRVDEFNTHNLDGGEGTELENRRNKDPGAIAIEVTNQTSYLRKLKFQYLEQNAKDKYVKSIVSDIDDAPIVTAEQNNKLAAANEEKKGKLKDAKRSLTEVQNDIRLLAPMVEKDYVRVRDTTDRAAVLAQNITKARQALVLLRQTHPHPRLTIALADDKLAEQVAEMQTLSDEVQSLKQRIKVEKGKMKHATAELEVLRSEAAEAQKLATAEQVEVEDDGRILPLYDWFTASLALHGSITNLEESHRASENELQLTYRIDTPLLQPHRIGFRLIFMPGTRRLAEAQVTGLDKLGVEIGDLVDSHVQVGSVHGFVAAVLMRVRAAVNS